MIKEFTSIYFVCPLVKLQAFWDDDCGLDNWISLNIGPGVGVGVSVGAGVVVASGIGVGSSVGPGCSVGSGVGVGVLVAGKGVGVGVGVAPFSVEQSMISNITPLLSVLIAYVVSLLSCEYFKDM